MHKLCLLNRLKWNTLILIKKYSPFALHPDQFQCAHGMKCIDEDQVCDGVLQCQDLSDEQHCTKQTEDCAHRCDKNRCLPAIFICDGDKDCLDGTDEATCGTAFWQLSYFTCSVQFLAVSHFSFTFFQRNQLRLMQLLCLLPSVHLVPSDALWAPNPAKTTLTVFTTTMSVTGRQTAEMAQMRKAAYQNVKVVSDLCTLTCIKLKNHWQWFYLSLYNTSILIGKLNGI